MKMTPIDSGLHADGRWMERTELKAPADSAPVNPPSDPTYFKSECKFVSLTVFG